MSYTITDNPPTVTVNGSSINIVLNYSISGYSLVGATYELEFFTGENYVSFYSSPNGTNPPNYTFTDVINGTYRVVVTSLVLMNTTTYMQEFDFTRREYSTHYIIDVVHPPTNLMVQSTSEYIRIIYDQQILATNFKYSLDNGVTYTLLSPAQTGGPIYFYPPTVVYGVTYQIRLKRIEGTKESVESSMVTGRLLPPAPTSLVAISNSNNITLTFQQTGTVTNYEYSLNNGTTYTAFSPLKTSSPIVLASPTINYGVTYQIKLKAVNNTDKSIESSMVTGKMPLLAPTSLVITPGNAQASISFTQPESGNFSITNYEYSLDNGTFTALSPAQTSSPIIISGLTNGTSYDLKLRAVNQEGGGESSSSYSFVPYTTPSAPTAIQVIPGNAQVTVFFSEPNNGGSLITNYEYSLDEGTSFTALNPFRISSPIIISGLTNGISYYLKLRAVNQGGSGDSSISSSSFVPYTTPSAPTSIVVTSGNAQVSISFSEPNNGGSPITNYEYSLDDGTSFTALSPSQTSIPITISGLTNWTSYQVKLRAVNQGGNGEASVLSSSFVPYTTPSAPTSLVATANEGNNNITLTFQQTDLVTNYKYSLNNGTTYTLFSPEKTSSPIVLESPLVDKRVPYQIRLKAVYNTEESVESQMVTVEIPCLLKGMKIKMADGSERKVEDIKEGDLVQDLLGRSIPVKKVFSTTVIGNHKNIPYVIPKNIFEKNVPTEDIYISYNHAFYYEKWGVPLHNDILKQDHSFLGKLFTYYHFELPNYSDDKLMCHGLPVDSYENSKDLI